MPRLLTLVVTLLLCPWAAVAAPITSLYVFGDSLSDQGNAFLITAGTFPPAPYAGRGSNGPVAAERLADRLGVALAPSAAGGTNFAVLGAATGPVNIPGTSVVTDNYVVVRYGQPLLANTGILNQVGAFLATGPVIDPLQSLFMVWGGANDFFLDPSAAAAANAATNIGNAIGALYLGGARRFLVPNIPDLSLTPSGLALPPAQRAGLQALALGFNAGLSSALDVAEALLPGIDIVRFDTFALLTALATNPAAFGFSIADTPCLSGTLQTGVLVCANPDSYVFWDSSHPTTAAHRVLGDAFADAVAPEPATIALLGVGMALMAGRRVYDRRRN
jgi:phospholipase/lecithinase/hemolysin